MHKVRWQGAGTTTATARVQAGDILRAAHHRDLNHDPYEERLKARLHAVTNFVENLTGSTITLLLAEKPLAREMLQEIVIEEAALRWIVRVAAVSAGSVRERLWNDIEKALDDLEVIINLLGRVDIAWPPNQMLEFRDELAHIT